MRSVRRYGLVRQTLVLNLLVFQNQELEPNRQVSSTTRHGYARWQYIIEDEEAGIIDIVRRELNLPTRSFSGSVQTNESANSAQPANTAHNANGSTEAAKAGYNSYQSRELQRRLVESIRKRYFLLEKALELECYKVSFQFIQL
ncbi:hypothetical protein GW17_00003717 [Ensete ventricosum]|nr:hypothetical protein GW17_00003717 [Ensete ventricosum]